MDTPDERPGYSAADQERWAAEGPKSKARTAFERDRARVVHSSALRRLGAKTQVLGPSSDDFIRTRLTHTLEVAQVGRELGKALGCDPDIVDAACLSHDLGHPPFGHNGERALANVARGIGGFEGNAQTLRLLTRLEPKTITDDGASAGLNLTRASLDASVKYPWELGRGPQGKHTHKFGVYPDDLPVYTWLREGAPEHIKCLEAQVMDLADDISYSVHDVEDAIVGGKFDLNLMQEDGARTRVIDAVHTWYGEQFDEAALRAAVARLDSDGLWVHGFDGSRQSLARLKNTTSRLIGRFCKAAHAATRAEAGDGPLTRYAANLVVPPETDAEILVLKGVAVAYVMAPRESEPVYQRQRDILCDLTAFLVEHPEKLENQFVADWREADADGARLRVVVDQVASLTDVSAVKWHAAAIGPRESALT